MARDSQRRKLYDAEWTIRRDSNRLPDSPSVEKFIHHVMTSVFVQSRWGLRKITYQQTRGGGGNYGWGTIRTGKNTTEFVILHELAHALTPNRADIADHGPEFAAVLLTLVDRFMGHEAGKTLRTAFRDRKVKWRAGMKAVPKPGTHRVITKTAVVQSRRAAIRTPVARPDRETAAATLRKLITQGEFGPSGSKTRTHALEVARRLEGR